METIVEIKDKILKYEKKIIECLVVCFVSGWATSLIARFTFKEINNKTLCLTDTFLKVMIMLLLCSIATAIIYFMDDRVARIIMFVSVYIYVVLCARTGYDTDWGAVANNDIGNVCFQVALSVIAILAFVYVKKDFEYIFAKVKMNARTTKIIVFIIGTLLFSFVAGVTVLRYYTYSNSTYDFGIFAQMFEYMKQKGSMETTCERTQLLSHFAVHFSPIFYIALPIYYIFSSPVTVQIIQAIMIALPVIPLYLLCKHYKLSNKLTVCMAMIYALYPATAGGSYYDIHENCFLTFTILFAIWALEKKKNTWLMVFTILTLFVKEDAFIYIAVLGAFILFSRKDKKRGIILIFVSLVYFFIAMKIVGSYGLGGFEHRFVNMFYTSDGGLIQIIQTVITNPGYAISQCISNQDAGVYDKIEYLMYMLVPLSAALFTKKKYSRYILLTPFVVINLFPTYDYLHSVTYQYNFGVIALFIYLMVMNVSEWKWKNKTMWAGIALICTSIMFMGTIYPKLTVYTSRYAAQKNIYKQMDEGIEMIPKDASVCASGFVLPHLADHLELYDQGQVENLMYTDYLVIDARYQTSYDEFNNLIDSGKYESVYYKEGAIEIYKKIN